MKSSYGGVDVSADVNTSVVDAGAQASHNQTSSVELTHIEAVEVCISELAKKLQNSKFDMDNLNIQRLSKKKGVCVVIASARAKNKMNLKKNRSSKGSFSCKPLQAIVKGSVKMEGGRMEEIVCEEDTVLACKAVQFTISTTGCVKQWDQTNLCEFVEDEFSNRRFFETIAVSEDFKSLKRYIQREFSGFTSLNQSHRAEIWSLLSELLLHNEALTVLDSIMEKTERGDGEKLSLDMLDEELRGPVQRLLDYRGTSNTEIFSLVMSFISVLDVLSGQTVDLICGLDMKTLREQLELVEIVLQLADGSLSFCDSNWTNKYSEDSLSLVRELLTSCSLNMCDEEPSLVFKISSKQIPALYAMYSTLYVIYILNMK